MKFPGRFSFLCCMIMIQNTGSFFAQPSATGNLLETLLQKQPDQFAALFRPGNQYQVQILYTVIDRGKKGKIKFTDHSFQLDSNQYFYPASTVKLPVAILALQKLNELGIPALDRNSTMITGSAGDRQTEVRNDPTAKDGRPTIAHYIRKILLVSDNDAYNRLYEFLGQEYINNELHRLGFTEAQIIHRLEISLSEAENRHTNPVHFYDTSGRLLYAQPDQFSKLTYAPRHTRMGKGFMRNGVLVNEPFDFSAKNRLSLSSLHEIIKRIMFPEAFKKSEQFNLTAEDYAFLRQYMSMMPAESNWPRYNNNDAWDTYVKFLYYGAEPGTAEPGIRIFNKPGDAYGFMIDAAYLASFRDQTECIISAVIHCNSDGIYNDDRYEYKTVGLPFMKALGRMLMAYEQTRVRKNKPDLHQFLFNYRN